MSFNNLHSLLIITGLSLSTLLFLGLGIAIFVKYRRYYKKYEDVIDIDKEISKRTKENEKLKLRLKQLEDDYLKKENELRVNYQEKRSVYANLLREISILEEDIEFTTYGVYKPHYDFDTSEKYKETLNSIRQKQKLLIKEKRAIVCPVEWEVGGSKREGKKMKNRYMKLMLRAFNNECDAAVLKVKWNNITRMEERLSRAFDAINKLGETQQIRITGGYRNLKLDELHLAYEYQEKLHEEKEEQKRIREQMREEERVQREIEKAKEEAEDEEKRYSKALEQAKADLKKATGEEIDHLNQQLVELQKKLKAAEEKKERALARAQLTKSGHVYVISNIGSFGDNIYKIGMTRRLEPIDRVKELGDASVPFRFDVHAMIYSEDAPELENALHTAFDPMRVNLINHRKEFFHLTLDDIEKGVMKNHGEIEFTKLAEAREYHETLNMREEESQRMNIEEVLEEKFPAEL